MTSEPLPSLGATLVKVFESANLKILDVGARSGPHPGLAVLAPYAELFLCEPDPAEADRLERERDGFGPWKQVRILREALNGAEGRFDFFATRQAGLNSLLKPDRLTADRYFERPPSLWDVVDQWAVETVTLEQSAARHTFDDLAFIKLDTQGTELAILQSGVRSPLRAIVAVQIEMLVQPFYQGQASFSDIHGFLDAQGFRLLDLKRTTLRHRSIAPPVYSKRELSWCHGVYLRCAGADGGSLSDEQTQRLFCLAFAGEFFDRAIAILEHPAHAACFGRYGPVDALIEETRAYATALWTQIARRTDEPQRSLMLKPFLKDRERER